MSERRSVGEMVFGQMVETLKLYEGYRFPEKKWNGWTIVYNKVPHKALASDRKSTRLNSSH